MLQELVTDLQKKLEQLSKEYHQCQASDSELNLLRQRARDFYNPEDSFTCITTRSLVTTLVEKLAEGYTYCDSDSTWTDVIGTTNLNLRRPEHILTQEYKNLDDKVVADYLKSIEDKRADLLKEIARTKLSIRDAYLDIEERAKRQKEFDSFLTEIKEELVSQNMHSASGKRRPKEQLPESSEVTVNG